MEVSISSSLIVWYIGMQAGLLRLIIPYTINEMYFSLYQKISLISLILFITIGSDYFLWQIDSIVRRYNQSDSSVSIENLKKYCIFFSMGGVIFADSFDRNSGFYDALITFFLSTIVQFLNELIEVFCFVININKHFAYYSAKDFQRFGIKRSKKNKTCTICQEIGGSAMIVTPCSHYFCQNCLLTWFNMCRYDKRNSICPMCRRIYGEIVHDVSSETESEISESEGEEEGDNNEDLYWQGMNLTESFRYLSDVNFYRICMKTLSGLVCMLSFYLFMIYFELEKSQKYITLFFLQLWTQLCLHGEYKKIQHILAIYLIPFTLPLFLG